MEPPIYSQTIQYATEHGELDAYFASMRANSICVASIGSAINSNFRDNILEWENALKSALGQHSVDRIQILLAWQIKERPWDGRYSQSNKAWAASVDTAAIENSEPRLYINCHPGLIDLFTTAFRRDVLERSHSEQHEENTQHRPAERSEDFEL